MYISASMNVYDLNIKGNMYVVGLPALTGIAGFAAAVEFELKQQLQFDDAVNISAALLIESCEPMRGISRDVTYEYGLVKKPEMTNASLNDKKTATLSGTVILKVECQDADDEIAIEDAVKTGLLWSLINRMRFVGGTISLRSKTLDFDTQFESLLSRCLMRTGARNAFVLEDACGLLESERRTNESMLNCLLRLVSRPKANAAESPSNGMEEAESRSAESDADVSAQPTDTEAAETYLGYLVPTAIGYMPVEDPQTGRQTRTGTPHAYAEPVIGLGRLRSTPSLLAKLAAEEFESLRIFWRYPKQPLHQMGGIVLADSPLLQASDE